MRHDVSSDVPLADAAVRPDAPSIDTGRDAPAVDRTLQEALSCELTSEVALAAMVRHVACLERRENASVGGFYEAWEVGLFSAIEPAHTSFHPGLGCAAWRCVAEATSCGEARRCLAPPAACEPSDASYCDGDELVSCVGSERIDCAALGMRCTDEGCAVGECVVDFGTSYRLACDEDDVVLCDGARRIDCQGLGLGSCAHFAISGEVPTVWCSPDGMNGYGAYGSPIECEGGRIAFESAASGDRITFDCTANGYTGCDEWGCLP